LMTSSLMNLWNTPSEDYAAARAQDIYNHDIRTHNPLMANQNAALLFDMSGPGQIKNALVGGYNLGVKALSGVASLPGLFGGTEIAASWQRGVNETLRLNVDSPLADVIGRSLAPTMNRLQGRLEDRLGVGGAALVNAGAEFLLDASVVTGAGLGLRRLAPELDVTLGGSRTTAVRPNIIGASAEESLFDYAWRQVSEADFSTPTNKAAFYTDFEQGNFARATAWADANQGFVIDRTPGGSWLSDLHYGAKAEFSRAEADLLWRTASARYAAGASGDVHIFNSGVPYDPNKVLYSVELPILRQNPNVNLIWK